MRKNLSVKAYSLYITLFLSAAALAQARPLRALDRGLDPDPQLTIWEILQRTYVIARRAFDVLKFPIG